MYRNISLAWKVDKIKRTLNSIDLDQSKILQLQYTIYTF